MTFSLPLLLKGTVKDHQENKYHMLLSYACKSQGKTTALGVCFLPVWIEGAQCHSWESQPVGVKVEVEVDRIAEVLPVEDPKLPVH